MLAGKTCSLANRKDINVTKADNEGPVVIIDVVFMQRKQNTNSTIKTPTKGFNVTQHKHIQDKSMTQ